MAEHNHGIARFDRSTPTSSAATACATACRASSSTAAPRCALRDGRLAFGGVHGFNVFAPQRIAAQPLRAARGAHRRARRRRAAAACPAPEAALRVDKQADRMRALRVRGAGLRGAGAQPFRSTASTASTDDWIDAGTRPRRDLHQPRPGPLRVPACARTNHDGVLERERGRAGRGRDAAVVGQRAGAWRSTRSRWSRCIAPAAAGAALRQRAASAAPSPQICRNARSACNLRCGARATSSGTGTCATTRCTALGADQLLGQRARSTS